MERRYHRFPIGTGVRKKFSSVWFDGEVVKIHPFDKLWSIKYPDGDIEDMNEDEMITYSSKYNQHYNTK